MSDIAFRYILISWIILALAVFVSLFFINAPYGRHLKKSGGPIINGKIGWILMEIPAPLCFALVFMFSHSSMTLILLLFLLLWELHYLDHALLYPLTIRLSSRPLPVLILIAGMLFNFINAFLNSQYLVLHVSDYTADWLSDPRFLIGTAVFVIGFFINRRSDFILYKLRLTSPEKYIIPNGGLYDLISCPNYFGEILIWAGWMVLTWSPMAAAFLIWTIANLAPRAFAHHKWYQSQFEDYPEARHALIPWIW